MNEITIQYEVEGKVKWEDFHKAEYEFTPEYLVITHPWKLKGYKQVVYVKRTSIIVLRITLKEEVL